MWFLLQLLLINTSVFSQAVCTELTIVTGAQPYNCGTLIISPGAIVNFPPAPNGNVDINVTGDVVIGAGAFLNLAGGDGSTSIGGAPGGIAGPGGTDGGDASPFPNPGPDTSGGQAGVDDGGEICGGGGGGGGFSIAGDNGSLCPAAAGGTGGAFHDLNALFRGGFGGGAGGLSDFGNPPLETATGGGGGGALRIIAGGNITNDGDIDVTGGDGGVGANKSGGGGGGSGGVIWLQATGQIVNNGTFFISGGQGGNGNLAGGSGGDGADGVFEMIDADNVIAGVGTGAIGLGGNDEETFRSSISCGAVKMKNDQMFFQMMAGFMLIVLISKIRGLIRRSV